MMNEMTRHIQQRPIRRKRFASDLTFPLFVAGIAFTLVIGLGGSISVEKASSIQRKGDISIVKLSGEDTVVDVCPIFAPLFYDSETFSHPLLAAAKNAGEEYGVERELIYAVMASESGCEIGARSAKGAIGLMQLMPATARWLGVRNPQNVTENIRGGTRYLALLLRQFNGNLPVALAAYNAGPETVKRYGGIPPFRETKRYIERVLRYHGELQARGKQRADVNRV